MHLSDAHLRERLEPPDPHWRSEPGRRDAAVLAPLFAGPDGDHLLFTRRRDDLPKHGGELSFPGGAREGDESALACALRETREEIGLDPGRVEMLGRLPERCSIHAYQVHVFVGRIASIEGLTIDQREVQHVVTIPVAELLRQERWEFREVQGRRKWRNVPFFPHGDEMLWGLTARFTLDLIERIA